MSDLLTDCGCHLRLTYSPRCLQDPVPSHVFRHGAQLDTHGARHTPRCLLRDCYQDVGLHPLHAPVQETQKQPGNPYAQPAAESAAWILPCLVVTDNNFLGTIIKVIDVAFMLLTGKSRKMRYQEYSCDLRKAQVTL